jgi:hypothetical protein
MEPPELVGARKGTRAPDLRRPRQPRPLAGRRTGAALPGDRGHRKEPTSREGAERRAGSPTPGHRDRPGRGGARCERGVTSCSSMSGRRAVRGPRRHEGRRRLAWPLGGIRCRAHASRHPPGRAGAARGGSRAQRPDLRPGTGAGACGPAVAASTVPFSAGTTSLSASSGTERTGLVSSRRNHSIFWCS